jgi:hypothetical protein
MNLGIKKSNCETRMLDRNNLFVHAMIYRSVEDIQSARQVLWDAFMLWSLRLAHFRQPDPLFFRAGAWNRIASLRRRLKSAFRQSIFEIPLTRALECCLA